MNRCFLKKRSKKLSYEEKRAIELMKVLDKCEALLDLHAYNEPYIESVPFAICEKNCLEIVKNFDVEYALTGIDKIEKGGTDGYMFNSGKIGICVELGSIENYEKFIDLGIKTSYQFLQYFEMVDDNYRYDKRKQIILRASDIYKKQNTNFNFTEKFSTFDSVKKNTIICRDGEENIKYQKDKYILFPRDKYDIGVEVFILAEKV